MRRNGISSHHWTIIPRASQSSTDSTPVEGSVLLECFCELSPEGLGDLRRSGIEIENASEKMAATL